MRARPSPLAAPLTVVAALATLAGGCGKEIKQSYDIDIVGMSGDVFAGADQVKLLINGREVSRTSVHSMTGFSLDVPDLDPNVTPRATFAVRAEKSDGTLFAYGQSPEVEVRLLTTALRVYVQPPATLKDGHNLDGPVAQQAAAVAVALPVPPLELTMPVPLLGLGTTRTPETTGSSTTIEIASADVYLYSPLSHLSGALATAPARRQAAAATRPSDGKVFLFGGIADTVGGVPAHPTGWLDVFSVSRADLSTFVLSHDNSQENPNAARSATVLLPVDKLVFAFGGVGADGLPLDSIVKIDYDSDPTTSVACAACTKPFTGRMLAARSGHTVTPVTTADQKHQALVFGGAAASGPAAELVALDTPNLTSQPLTAPPGAGRRGHAALLIGSDATMASRVLIVGGNDGTKVLDDALLYDAGKGTLMPAGLKLQTARQDFTAFVLKNDIVVFGGLGADGQPLDSGEIFDLSTLAPAGTIQGLKPRAGATAAVLSNDSAIIMGGIIPNTLMKGTTIQSNLVEIYQPRRQ